MLEETPEETRYVATVPDARIIRVLLTISGLDFARYMRARAANTKVQIPIVRGDLVLTSRHRRHTPFARRQIVSHALLAQQLATSYFQHCQIRNLRHKRNGNGFFPSGRTEPVTSGVLEHLSDSHGVHAPEPAPNLSRCQR